MQGTWSNRRKLITAIIVIASIILLVGVDQGFKYLFLKINNQRNIAVYPIKVIKNFFYFTFVYNTGSAYSFLADVSWAQTFFKILTPIALLGFSYFLYYAIKKQYLVLTIALGLVIAGTIGNFLDRLILNKVIDFLTILIGGNRIFGVFNIADVFLSVGIIMVIVHFMFLDESALFGKKNGKTDTPND